MGLETFDANAAAWIITGIVMIIGVVLPYRQHRFLDLGEAELTTLRYYGWIHLPSLRRSLRDFRSITVRLVCHPGGEGSDTYTGSVGLRPAGGGPVVWLKEFPTTSDEMPRGAYEYARQLQEVLPLPVFGVGCDLAGEEFAGVAGPRG